MDLLRDAFPNLDVRVLEAAYRNAHHDVNIAFDQLIIGPPPAINRRDPELLDLSPSPASPPDLDDRKSPIDRSERSHSLELDAEDNAVAKLLQLFPDACITFLKEQYKAHHQTQGSNVVEFLADKFLEEGYSRAEKVGRKRKRDHQDEEEDKVPAKRKYNIPDRPPETAEYYVLMRKVLSDEFPLLPVSYIDRVAYREGFIALAYPDLIKAQRQATVNPAAAPCRLLARPRKARGVESVKIGGCLSRVLDELEHSREEARRQRMQEQIEQDAQLAAKLNEKEHQDSKMLMECQCCFGDVPFDGMTHCGEGLHFFCLDCARRNAENEIGNSRYKLMCMDGSGCRAEFTQSEIARFLDPKAIMALERLQQEEALRVAEIDGLVQCPFCDYAAICGPIEEDKEFRCQNPECMEISCRHCQKKTHIPLSCKEASKDDMIAIRHAVEEAMTQAMIRKCNKCKSPFIKEYGCNKMTCTKPGCHGMQCYVCSKSVTGYDHFNDKARGGKEGNCPLFDNVEERHEQEILQAAEAAKKKLQEENPELADEDLEIQLSEAAKQQEEARKRRAQPDHFPFQHPNVVFAEAQAPPRHQIQQFRARLVARFREVHPDRPQHPAVAVQAQPGRPQPPAAAVQAQPGRPQPPAVAVQAQPGRPQPPAVAVQAQPGRPQPPAVAAQVQPQLGGNNVPAVYQFPGFVPFAPGFAALPALPNELQQWVQHINNGIYLPQVPIYQPHQPPPHLGVQAPQPPVVPQRPVDVPVQAQPPHRAAAAPRRRHQPPDRPPMN